MIIAHFIETLVYFFFFLSFFMFLAWGRGGQERLGGRYQVRENSPPVKSENMQLCALMCVLPKMKAWGSCSPAGQEDSG